VTTVTKPVTNTGLKQTPLEVGHVTHKTISFQLKTFLPTPIFFAKWTLLPNLQQCFVVVFYRMWALNLGNLVKKTFKPRKKWKDLHKNVTLLNNWNTEENNIFFSFTYLIALLFQVFQVWFLSPQFGGGGHLDLPLSVSPSLHPTVSPFLACVTRSSRVVFVKLEPLFS